MIDRTKKIIVRFFQNNAGRKPVRDWLLDLSADHRRIIGHDIETVEFGWPVGMPVCRSLGQGLWEVRSDLSGGVTARIIFCIVEGEMILLHGFIKKTQKASRQDIDIAIRRRKEID